MAKLISAGKVEASTLVEVLISMVIIMAVFVTGIAIYVNVTRSGTSVSQLQAARSMEDITQESIRNKDFEDQDIQRDSIDYHKSVRSYAGYPDLALIEVEGKQNGRSLGKYKRLVKREVESGNGNVNQN